MNVHARLAKLTTKKITPVKAPTPVVDLETEALAAKLMAQFSRPIATVTPSVTGEPTPAPVAELPKTMSVSDKEFQMLKSQKEAETRALAAERKAENLEKTLIFVVENLSTFVMKQQETLAGTINGLLTPFQIEMAQLRLGVIRTVSQLALRLFCAWPQIADTALHNLGATEEDVALWRKWHAAYKSQEHAVWLEKLADLQKHNDSSMLPGQEAFFVAALQQDGVDVKRRLEEISAERLRRCERPILVSPRSGTYER